MLIKNYQALLRTKDKKLQAGRDHLLSILEFSLNQSDPYNLTLKALGGIYLGNYQKIFVVGAGKGTYRMALASEEFLGSRLKAGAINVPAIIKDGQLKKIKVSLAGHPFPDEGSIRGAKEIVSLVRKSGRNDLILGLFSGGASALFAFPSQGISLNDKIAATNLLLRSGADINEINAVRKHLSRVKGGRLAELAKDTNLIALYLSDVIGDDLSTVASGPTAPDQTTFRQALEILEKYGLDNKVPRSVRLYLERGERGEITETLKHLSGNVKNIVIGNHKTLARAASVKARQSGFRSFIVAKEMQGVTEKVGVELLEVFRGQSKKRIPTLLIATGETTFKVGTKNPGGRNQQMGLAVMPRLKSGEVFLAFDSDGVDGVGPERVGGVLVDGERFKKVRGLKLNFKKALRDNASYDFFERVGGQIKTDYVGTNLGDIVMLLNYL